MKHILTAAGLFVALLSFSQHYSRAKVLTGPNGLKQLAELGIAVDHGQIKKNTFFISDFSSDEIQAMQNAGFVVEILIADVQQFYVARNNEAEAPTRDANCPDGEGSTFVPEIPANFNQGSMAGFYTYQEFLDEIDAMAAAYPNLITVKAQISTFQTIEGRPIYYLRMSDNPNSDEAEPEVLYTAVHHAREPNSLSQLIFYMWYLLENYQDSEEIQYLLNNTELYFVPMLNPDGYIYNQTTEPGGGGMWRKNRRDNGGAFGVDLNRNYSHGWGTTGISTNPANDTYPGTGPFSEPETQAIKWFCENHDFQFAFNAHTYGNDILFPFGDDADTFAPDHDYFLAFTGHMVQYSSYDNKKASELYEASGDSDDYMYADDLTVKPRIFAMTPEIGADFDDFWPQQSRINTICQDMVFPNIVLAHLTHRYLEVKDIGTSTIETTTGNFQHNALRFGQENGPVTVSIVPLTGIQSVGSPVTHDLAIMEDADASISYVLNANIQFGDQVKYVLQTIYTGWTHRDTIIKTFGAVPSQFLDNASTATNWTGTWGATTAAFVSPSQSFTDSPGIEYANSSYREFTLNNAIDLTNADAAGVKFYARWDIEQDYDYCQFQISIDNGNSWIAQCGRYTTMGLAQNNGVQPIDEPLYEGVQTEWVLEEISLNDYLGETIRMRFVLESDAGVRADGFYFDDFEVMYQTTSGLDETALGTIRVLPNPAGNVAYIAFDQPVSEGEIEVFDLSGKRVHVQTILSLTNKVALPAEQWNNGVYTVVVTTSEGVITPVKLVVAH